MNFTLCEISVLLVIYVEFEYLMVSAATTPSCLILMEQNCNAGALWAS